MSNFYKLLKEKFPRKEDIVTEMINLEAICQLPKGTEYFISDLHGEYDAVDYLLRTGAGSIRAKLLDCFDWQKIVAVDLDDFCILLYYPKEKLAFDKMNLSASAYKTKLWEMIPLQIQVLKYFSSKYTKSKVRKQLSGKFAYIIEELLAEIDRNPEKKSYFDTIIEKLFELDQVEDLIIVLSQTIQVLIIDHLHVVGDIYDRGRYPDRILNRLMAFPNLDIQWGNHDVTWMGAASGSYLCMVNVIRIAARYNNITLIEDRYGINLRRLVDYSRRYYEPLPSFVPILDGEEMTHPDELDLLNMIQQATAILQFKLEAQLIDRRPEFQMHNRQLINQVNYKDLSISIKEVVHQLKDFNSRCIDSKNPSRLTSEEEELLQQLMIAFQTSESLKKHIDFLFEKGSMYLTYNDNLLFHGCIPMHSNGDFKSFKIAGKTYGGRDLLDLFESQIRLAYARPEKHDDLATDIIWYLWCGENSSLFGKNAMTTFERYYVSDKVTHQERKNPYFKLRDKDDICTALLQEFDLPKFGHIVNGHTPVKEKNGEQPIKANGKMLVIDGGFAKGYQKNTGLAGYTLIYNSYGIQLISHLPFTSIEEVLSGTNYIIDTKRLVEEAKDRILVKDTTIGQKLTKEIKDLDHRYRHFQEYDD